MERVRFLDHRGRRILHVDLSGLSELDEIRPWVDMAVSLVRQEPPGSALVLIELSGVPYALRLVRLLGEAAASNRAYVRARAVVGMTEVATAAAAEIVWYSGRPAEFFAEREEALDWLLSVDADPSAGEGRDAGTGAHE